MYTIGQLAKAAGVNVETIRYYERQQLILQPDKPSEGYRRYPEDMLFRILFIKRAQHLGFTLAEIATLINLGEGHCNDVQNLAEKKLSAIHQKITDLQSLEKSLNTLVRQCRSNPDDARCPVIEALVPEKNHSP